VYGVIGVTLSSLQRLTQSTIGAPGLGVDAQWRLIVVESADVLFL
jgi:hypothetical protein